MDFRIDSSEQATATPTERQIVPVGIRTMEIKHAEETTSRWKTSDDNPHGHVLALRLADMNGDFRFVFDDIAQHDTPRARALIAALGRQPSGGVVSLTPANLVGQVITVEVTHYTAKSTGNTSARVQRYVPAESRAQKQQSTPRTAPPQEVAAGDIPF